MLRSMMQIIVKHSDEAFELYREAFDARVLCAYPNEGGGWQRPSAHTFPFSEPVGEGVPDLPPPINP